MKILIPALLAIGSAWVVPTFADVPGLQTPALTGNAHEASKWRLNRIRTADRDDYADRDVFYDDGYDIAPYERYTDDVYDSPYGGYYYPRGYRGRYSKSGRGTGYYYAQDGVQSPAQQGGMRGR